MDTIKQGIPSTSGVVDVTARPLDRPPEVELTLGAALETAGMLEVAVLELEKRLAPVMRSAQPQQERAYVSLVDDNSAPLAQRVASINSHLQALQGRLVDMLDRLEV